MMETEEQQLEEIRHWWQEHGKTVIAGVVLGLGTVIGWTTWRNHQETTAEQLSTRYQMIVNAAEAPDYAQVRELADELIAEYPKSSYSALSALLGAHAAYTDGDAGTAERLLDWAVNNAKAFDVANVARLRLARIVSEKGELDKALELINAVDGDDFAALRLEARGDVLQAKSDRTAARSAYEEALKVPSLQGDVRARLELKRDELSELGG
jgi:predicted negative regulator of RcsB-dependent stress response